MAELDLLYKITTLELLSKVDFPLTNSQITDFFLSANYTDYFRTQEIIHNLEENHMIHSDSSHNSTQYTITSEGLHTLDLFKDKITEGIQQDIQTFFKENQMQIKAENSVTADYYRATGGGFLVHCKASEEQTEILSLNLHVDTKEQAEAICYNWKVKYEDVYMTILDQLVQ